ncbi:PAS domain-containing protein [Calothrix sp. PCC 7507]|uniref:PAS domain-containing protein n=1 Tax=Calothrix sp. PCC 7507 TaxID=99598 RepID=UPI00029F2BDB|nr:PAS domain-containing protein [Calothrix sp. PCC 7507]AFY30799.1 multi-sensor signal transduction histidine kinase [Calothrix sp. PCC 7507]
MAQALTVLIIDDCLEDREVYRRYLLQDREYNYTILEEESGERGLEVCRQFQPDGILLDFLLPDLDGLEFLEQLKKQAKAAMPAVIMLTGYGNEAVAVQAMKRGVQDYLVKGQTTGDLLRSTVHSAIKNAQLSQELQRSEERFRTSIENMLDCFGIYSAIRNHRGEISDFRIDYVNAAACEFNQMAKEKQLGKGLCEILPIYRESGLFDEYCQVVETGKPLIKESLIYTSFDKTKAFDARITKMGDGFVASWRDVTEKKQAEERLQESQRLIERIAETTPGIVYVYDLVEQRNVYINRQVNKLLGYTAQQIQAQSPEFLPQFMHPEDLISIAIFFQKFNSAKDGDILENEYQMRHANGEWRWFFSRDTIFTRNADGSPRQIVGTAFDITERKLAEVALRQSEERYRYLSDAVPQIVWISNAEGECEHINQKWDEFTGQPIEQAMGFGWTEIVHLDDIPGMMEKWLAAVHTGELYEHEMRYRSRDGTYRWHLARGLPMKDEQGDIIKWFGTSTDIDDRKQLEAERHRLLQLEQTARAAAEVANNTKDEFVAMVSHDLRSPLNAIMGWAKLLRTQQMDTASINNALETIERNAKSQATLLEDLLNMSRIIQGKLQLNLGKVNLAAIVAGAMETAYPSAHAKSICLESVVDKSIPPIRGDWNRLLQVLGNLLSNAMKFTPSGGQVEVKLLRNGSNAEITVSDTGIGISPEFLPHVFERYFQGDRIHKQSGLGLGLAIARHLVELHGGTIEVASPGVGLGSTFTIKLPC